MHRFFTAAIGFAFLAYSLLRIGVGSAMLGQELGILDVVALQEPLLEVGEFLKGKADQQLFPLTVTGYLAYIVLMGLTLLIGATGSLTKRRFGLPLIATFLLMYAGLFINFQTINPKIIHLAVSTLLFLLLALLKKRERT